MKLKLSILFTVLFLHGAILSVSAKERELTANEVAVKKIAKAFAASSILGTGGSQYLTSISVQSNEKAVAIIGQNDTYGNDPTAYQANLKKIKGQWKIISIEFIFRPTGEKKMEDIAPPFPDPYWDKLTKENK